MAGAGKDRRFELPPEWFEERDPYGTGRALDSIRSRLAAGQIADADNIASMAATQAPDDWSLRVAYAVSRCCAGDAVPLAGILSDVSVCSTPARLVSAAFTAAKALSPSASSAQSASQLRVLIKRAQDRAVGQLPILHAYIAAEIEKPMLHRTSLPILEAAATDLADSLALPQTLPKLTSAAHSLRKAAADLRRLRRWQELTWIIPSALGVAGGFAGLAMLIKGLGAIEIALGSAGATALAGAWVFVAVRCAGMRRRVELALASSRPGVEEERPSSAVRAGPTRERVSLVVGDAATPVFEREMGKHVVELDGRCELFDRLEQVHVAVREKMEARIEAAVSAYIEGMNGPDASRCRVRFEIDDSKREFERPEDVPPELRSYLPGGLLMVTSTVHPVHRALVGGFDRGLQDFVIPFLQANGFDVRWREDGAGECGVVILAGPLAVSEQIRQVRQRHPKARLVVVLARTATGEESCRQAGADVVLRAPFSQDLLWKALK